ncbi:HlyD family type I secretion periplasmic adaptor subunit [Brucella gallinifaecis]|uniref:Membrane fusion protein (MFP) family protein n=1 Tax=Brucella gallinifaecis TaxID=215590 RepID=A0A502BLG9_9HYPH|nr:HlyD family type I secretion periplasmic adaptor subunit [Brucella gallinifaecis]TPF73923.1 HlyD family type I secretion periplasmic adaptor subunit [Brucella gallinifaecis]
MTNDVVRLCKPPMFFNDDKPFVWFGWVAIFFGVFLFFAWAAFAPLDKSVPAHGVVSVAGHRKTVQAPQIGTISSIFVKDGDKVQAGDVLIRLSSRREKSQLNSFLDQYYMKSLVVARLLAEQDGLAKMVLPEDLKHIQHQQRFNQLLSLQEKLLDTRRMELNSDVGASMQAIDGLKSRLLTAQERNAYQKAQANYVAELFKRTQGLADQGYAPKNKLLEFEIKLADLRVGLGDSNGEIDQLEKQIQESQLRIEQRKATFQRDVQIELTQIQFDISELKSKIELLTNDLDNTTIVAPVDGTIIGLNVFTKDGIVNQGQPLMDIVPHNNDIYIEARLPVHLVSKVGTGRPVDLLFTAYDQNELQRVPGIVTNVSADQLTGDEKKEPYYALQIRITEEGKKKLSKFDIKAGMPVNVFVKYGSHSLLDYLLKPIYDRIPEALAE